MRTFTRLLGLIAPYRASIVLAMVLSFLTIASSVALMATSAYLISKAALVTDVAALGIVIASVRLFAMLRAAFRYAERLLSHRTTLRLLAHMRVWFFAAIEPLAPARLSRYRSGDLLARIVADIETLENFYIRVLVPPVSAALAIVFACAILGAFDVQLALALAAFLLVTGVVLPLAMRWLGRRPASALVAARAELDAMLVDEIEGTAELLVFDRDRRHLNRTLSLSRDLNRAQERMAWLLGLSEAFGLLFASLAAITVLWLAIPLVDGGALNGVYLALLPLTAIASFEAVQPLPSAFQQLAANQASGKRVFELVDASPPVNEPEHPVPVPRNVDIEFRDVCFRYDPADPLALDGVNFTMPMGSWTALTGPSGAGKSTLVNLLLRFWDVQAGTIAVGGRDVRAYRADDLRALYGVLSQDIYLFNATIKDNLLLANPDATDAQIAAACSRALLHDFVMELPQGYETLIGENGMLLSGGERQRLAIARVFLRDAPILILDEPTANLDAETERRLLERLLPFLKNRTALIISHRPAVLECADQILVLENGRVDHDVEHADSRWQSPKNGYSTDHREPVTATD